MELSISEDQFQLTLYAKTHITGYIGCTKNSMLAFFIGRTNELYINQNLTLNKNPKDCPSTYYFMKSGVKVDVEQSEAMNFLAEVGRYLKV